MENNHKPMTSSAHLFITARGSRNKSERKTARMAATLKRQRKLPHYQRQQLGKRHDSSGRKRCQKQLFFSFPHKGRTQFLFPSCGLLSYESWAWHAFHADCFIVEIKRTMSKILIRTTTGAKTLTIYPDRTCSVSKTL